MPKIQTYRLSPGQPTPGTPNLLRPSIALTRGAGILTCFPSTTTFVLATGVGFTIKDFLEVAFGHVGLDWAEYVRFDERYLRPTEVDALIGDPSKAADKLGWVPAVHGDELARLMVDADTVALEQGAKWIDTVSLPSWSNRELVGARA